MGLAGLGEQDDVGAESGCAQRDGQSDAAAAARQHQCPIGERLLVAHGRFRLGWLVMRLLVIGAPDRSGPAVPFSFYASAMLA
jgi:hypothetical protein